MKHAVWFSIIFLLLISWMEKNGDTLTKPNNGLDTIQPSYLALGDSYTIGESVADTESFPVKTAGLLRGQGIHMDKPDIIAVTGWTTTNLLQALNTHPVQKTYSIVTLLIGVNNQYQGKTLEEYTTEFSKLLQLAISYAGNSTGHVFVLSIPDYSVTPFAEKLDIGKIAREIDAFNLANRTITNDVGAHYVEITPVSRDAKNNPALIAPDGLHPSALQYEKWSEVLAPLIAKEFHRK